MLQTDAKAGDLLWEFPTIFSKTRVRLVRSATLLITIDGAISSSSFQKKNKKVHKHFFAQFSIHIILAKLDTSDFLLPVN